MPSMQGCPSPAISARAHGHPEMVTESLILTLPVTDSIGEPQPRIVAGTFPRTLLEMTGAKPTFSESHVLWGFRRLIARPCSRFKHQVHIQYASALFRTKILEHCNLCEHPRSTVWMVDTTSEAALPCHTPSSPALPKTKRQTEEKERKEERKKKSSLREASTSCCRPLRSRGN